MCLDDFDFELPRRLIADHPCEPRDAARLLLIPASGWLQDRRISDLPALLRPGDLLVLNDTKVIPARLIGRCGDAIVEVTLHRDLGGGAWRPFAKARPKSKWNPASSPHRPSRIPPSDCGRFTSLPTFKQVD